MGEKEITNLLQLAFFDTSACTAMLWMPLLRNSSVTVWAVLKSISTTATDAPASPRACANALPRPCPAPEASCKYAGGAGQRLAYEESLPYALCCMAVWQSGIFVKNNMSDVLDSGAPSISRTCISQQYVPVTRATLFCSCRRCTTEAWLLLLLTSASVDFVVVCMFRGVKHWLQCARARPNDKLRSVICKVMQAVDIR